MWERRRVYLDALSLFTNMYFNPTTPINRFYITTLISSPSDGQSQLSRRRRTRGPPKAVCSRCVEGGTTGAKTTSKYSHKYNQLNLYLFLRTHLNPVGKLGLILGLYPVFKLLLSSLGLTRGRSLTRGSRSTLPRVGGASDCRSTASWSCLRRSVGLPPPPPTHPPPPRPPAGAPRPASSL